MKRTFAEITTDGNSNAPDLQLYDVNQKRKKIDE